MNELDPELIAQVLQMGENDPQAQALRRQQLLADRLRANAMQTPDVAPMAGRLVAPNYGQAISGLTQGFAARRMQPGIDQGMSALNSRNMAARQGYLAALMRANRRQVPQQSQISTPVPSSMGGYDDPEFHGGSY